jgi:CDP-glycerol glycerophosphotransferase (TagB/SpsB family)
MNKFFERCAKWFLFCLTKISPKSNTVVLRGFPQYEDNLIAIYRGLEARSVNKIIWIVDEPGQLPPVRLRNSTKFIKRRGLLDFYYCITSKFIFITHGHFLDSIPVNQVCVNLWHGIPFKAIGKKNGEKGRQDSITVATSSLTRKIFSEAFGASEEKIIITGQARTDTMLNIERDEVWRRICPSMPMPKRIFLWLPTYRRNVLKPEQVDGEVLDSFFNCSSFSQEGFNFLLRSNDALCFVKPHPLALVDSISDMSNIRYVDDAWLHEHRISLYELLGAADCLISDISSVIADFLLLDRPIVLLFEDIRAYANGRGFTFSPITDFLPANVNSDFQGFMNDIENVLLGIDKFRDRRTALRHIFFDHVDAGAVERILDHAMPGLNT